MTLRGLAEATGVSPSTLSRLENDLVQPNLAQLTALARTYQCSLDELVAPSASRVSMPAVNRDGVTFVPLARPAEGLHTFKVSVAAREPGGRRTSCAHGGHVGHQWIYVLSGTMKITAGRRQRLLTAGESADFDTREEHVLTGVDGGAVELIMVFGPEGQRQRVVDLGQRWLMPGRVHEASYGRR